MMRLGLIFLNISLVTSCFTACSTTMKKNEILESQLIPLAGSFKVHRFLLKNDLRLLLIEDHSSPTFAYQTWFRVGSSNEKISKTGLAHLFEHLMFKRTENLEDGEFDRLLERAGAEGENAFTSRDYTTYVQELPKDQLDLVARLESDRMKNLVVDDAAFQTEREVVQNERRLRNENNPDGLMDQELFGLAFNVHPYHWPVIGYEKDLAEMSPKDARDFYRSHYSPNHASLIIVGDVDPKEVVAVVRKYYDHLAPAPSPPSDPTEPIPVEPPQLEARRKDLPLNIHVEKLLMGYHVPEVTHEDTPALETLQYILGEGRSSRLHRALVNTGIASAAESFNFGEKSPSLFAFKVNLQKGKKAESAEAVILKQVWHLLKEGVPDAELERAKNMINFAFYKNLESNAQKAQFIGHFEAIAGDFTKGLKLYENIKKVTSEDIQRVVRKYLRPENRTVILGLPKTQNK